MSDDPSPTNGTHRRNFLRATGVALGAATLPATASARGPAESDAHTAKAEFGKGVSTGHIEEVRRAALAQYNARGGDLEAAPARSTPDPEDGTVVSYTYKIDENGVPHQYTGIAGDAESTARLHGKADTRARALDSGATASTDDVSTQASSWNTILHDEADFCKDPYGCVTNNFDLHELQDDGDYAQDAYSLHQFFVMEPGVQKYNSSWANEYGYPMHDWRQNSMGGEDLDTYDPLGTLDGSQTVNVSVGTGGVSLGWQYTQPAVTTIDNSSPSGNYAKWSQEFNTSDAQRNTNGMQPGSTAWIDQEASGSGYHDLMHLISEGQFFDTGWGVGTHSLKHTFKIDVYY